MRYRNGNVIMNKLHERSICVTKELEPNEGQRGLLCSNKVPHRCPSLGLGAINNFVGLSQTLKSIHIRLINEGYVIKDGRIYKPTKHTNA